MDALQWCRDRLLVPGNPLAASLLFVHPPQRERILALRGLITELAALDDPAAEQPVREARLGWWHQALAEGAPHPALEAMTDSGADERVSPDLLLALLASIGSAAINQRFERYEQLWSHCLAIGGQAGRLEARLAEEGEQDDSAAAALGGASYLIRIVRDLGLDARNDRWLVPLDLQAQFQVARRDAINTRTGPGWDGLVRTLLERAVREGNAARSRLSTRHRHLHIHWALDRRLAGQLVRRPGVIVQRRILPGHAGNVWTAWRAARRLAQQK
ncbi:squalene/phytoene synthase family protein [Wenzhouxiangella limi]|uniref:Squalene/phytoene synthase family protein n=1 Tax=Wenzhouxiangella limi TaxID=2707351 RepID=A0A845UXV6_9GAMM|nr:squalene/phytoene synthase family protein [Wenzhouxiangella limi]